MSTAIKNAKQLAKEQAERANFEAFLKAQPDFAGRPLVSCVPGGDPPDILCVDDSARRIGVELVQWINEEQTGPSKQRYKLEGSYTQVIRSWDEQPLQNIGLVFVNARDKTLRPADAAAFRSELYAFLANKDAEWPANPDWDDPQGWSFEDFNGFPTLQKHLVGLECYSRKSWYKPKFGSDWIQFHAHGGAYTADWMRDALLDNVRAKVVKYTTPTAQQRLTQEKFSPLEEAQKAIRVWPIL